MTGRMTRKREDEIRFMATWISPGCTAVEVRELLAELDATRSDLSRAKAEIEWRSDALAAEIDENLRIAARIGIIADIEAGKSYSEAEIGMFDALRARIAALEAAKT